MIPYIVAVACLLLMFAPAATGLVAWYRTYRWQRDMRRQWEKDVWNQRLQTSLSQMNGHLHVPSSVDGNTIH